MHWVDPYSIHVWGRGKTWLNWKICEEQFVAKPTDYLSHGSRGSGLQTNSCHQERPWIHELVGRRGKKVAAVALANKTVRTAFSMLTHGTEYKAELLVA
ncbi:MAG: hypothetical protein ACI9XK_004286 [Granulosicoccus sp.]|jgi:hypothetical protein